MAGSNSGRVIPREELSEFQRWQFSSLLDVSSPLQPAASSAPEPVAELPQTAASVPVEPVIEEQASVELADAGLSWPTAEEIEAIERQAQEEGYQAGLAAGRLAAETEVNRLRGLLGGLEAACRDIESRIAGDVLDLALRIARQMLREELSADRSRILPAIREAVAGLPAIKGPSRLLLNPDDLTAVNILLAGDFSDDYWRFVPAPSLSPGSCRIETPDSSVDLTMATRWRNLLQVLGRGRREELGWQAEEAPFAADSHDGYSA